MVVPEATAQILPVEWEPRIHSGLAWATLAVATEWGALIALAWAPGTALKTLTLQVGEGKDEVNYRIKPNQFV